MSVLNYDKNIQPAVTVVCITYKHEEYIRQALDSFLMQKTNFPFQIFVGEDKGPDSTADIVREYAEKYPDKIVAFLREENMGAQRNLVDMCQKANSPYIAFCEGDDYWVDEYKLQKQYDLMEAHPEYRACFAETEILAEEDWYLNSYYKVHDGIRSIPMSIPNYKVSNELTMDYYIKFGPAHTSSMFFRWNYDLKIPDWYYTHIYGDHPMMMMQVGDGILGYIPEVMSVYRRSDVGVLMNEDLVNHFINTRASWIEMAMDLEKYFKENYGNFANKEIKSRIKTEFINYISYLIKGGYSDKLIEVINKYPYAAEISITELLNFRNKYKKVENGITKKNMPLFMKKLPATKAFIKDIAKNQRIKSAENKKIAVKKFVKYEKAKKTPNLWIFTCEDNKFYGNTRHLYEYVVANHPEINAVWLTKNQTLQKIFLAENLPYVDAKSKEGERILKKASVIFVNKYLQNSCVFNGYNPATKIVRLSCESDYISFIQNKKYSKKYDDFSVLNPQNTPQTNAFLSERFSKTDLFVVPNSDCAKKLVEAFGLKDNQVLVCTNPNATATRTLPLVNDQTSVVYKIAQRENTVDTELVIKNLLAEIPAIEKHALENKYTMYIHICERDQKLFGNLITAKIKNCKNIILRSSNDFDNISTFDIMITDFDPAAANFILQDKPVISMYSDSNVNKADKVLKYSYTETISPKLNTNWKDALNDICEALADENFGKDFRIKARQILFDGAELNYHSSEKIINSVKEMVKM